MRRHNRSAMKGPSAKATFTPIATLATTRYRINVYPDYLLVPELLRFSISPLYPPPLVPFPVLILSSKLLVKTACKSASVKYMYGLTLNLNPNPKPSPQP
jgi:hypothetical protein